MAKHKPLRVIDAKPRNIEDALRSDPYVGYDSLEELLGDVEYNSQAEVLARMLARENLLVTGSAGSGKTTVVKPFQMLIEKEYPHINIQNVAYTGLAARNIGGTTIHHLLTQPSIIKNVDVLIIDEISMVPLYLFERLDQKMKRYKKCTDPFGGAQVVMVGDFLQLPPIPDREGERDSRHITFSKVFQQMRPKILHLDKLHRAQDPELVKILNEITSEEGLSDEGLNTLSTRVGVREDKGRNYVRIFSVNRKVDERNKQELDALPGSSRTYRHRVSYGTSLISGLSQKEVKEKVDREVDRLGFERLELKVGALVMSTVNNRNTGVYNGSIGTVTKLGKNAVWVDFEEKPKPVEISYVTHPILSTKKVPYQDTNGNMRHTVEKEVIGTVRALPLRLAYAITIHKSQGKTFDAAVVDTGQLFQKGLGYVAISRVRRLQDLILTGAKKSYFDMPIETLKITEIIKRAALVSRKEFIDDHDYIMAPLYNKWNRRVYWGELASDRKESQED